MLYHEVCTGSYELAPQTVRHSVVIQKVCDSKHEGKFLFTFKSRRSVITVVFSDRFKGGKVGESIG